MVDIKKFLYPTDFSKHSAVALPSMLLGYVAEKVVRKSPCPVFTVRHPEHKFEAP